VLNVNPVAYFDDYSQVNQIQTIVRINNTNM